MTWFPHDQAAGVQGIHYPPRDRRNISLCVDDDASPEVLETMEAAANIHENDTITSDGGKLIVGQGYASNTMP